MKVVERAKLMGVPAVQIGKVGGDKLTVKTADRRIFRAADRTARRLVEFHRPRDGVNFFERKPQNCLSNSQRQINV